MFAHFDRKAEHISNENLDRERTHLNYNLATHQTMDQGEFVRKRCAEVHCQNRKDVNVMATWVVTVPKDLPEQEHKAFFQASYDFLQQRYGRENVVSAYVHMDEVTPHMHFAFVPVKHGFKEDKKNPDISTEYRKVSAKEVLNRRELQAFHPALQRYVERELGHEVSAQEKALREAGIELPDPSKPEGRYNNRKITFDKMRREMFQEICLKHGLNIEVVPRPQRQMHKSVHEYKRERSEKNVVALKQLKKQGLIR